MGYIAQGGVGVFDENYRGPVGGTDNAMSFDR